MDRKEYTGIEFQRKGRKDAELKEALLAKAARESSITVPPELVQEEYELLYTNLRHTITYQSMGGGPASYEIQDEINERIEEMKAEAYYNVKEDLFLKALLEELNPQVTREDLEAEARRMSESQNTSMEMIYKFFGEDLALLERDAKIKKVLDYLLENAVITD